jgi:hypothetical protein
MHPARRSGTGVQIALKNTQMVSCNYKQHFQTQQVEKFTFSKPFGNLQDFNCAVSRKLLQNIDKKTKS